MDRAGLRDFALALPGTTESLACAGTALEAASFKVRGKAYLFIGPGEVRLKLRESLPEAEADARAQVGAHGWVKLRPEALPEATLGWVRESFRGVGGRE